MVSINEVNLRLARLVLGWVTLSGFISQWIFISVCNQPSMSTHPGHPFVGMRSEYQPKGGNALWLQSKGRYGLCVGGKQNCAITSLHTGHICALWRCRNDKGLYKFTLLYSLTCILRSSLPLLAPLSMLLH